MFPAPFRRGVACLLLPLSLFACTQWTSEPVSPEVLSNNREVRLVSTNGTWITIFNPAIVGDSIVGELDSLRLAVAVADVTAVEFKEPANMSTADEVGRVIGGVAGLVLMFFGIKKVAEDLGSLWAINNTAASEPLLYAAPAGLSPGTKVGIVIGALMIITGIVFVVTCGFAGFRGACW